MNLETHQHLARALELAHELKFSARAARDADDGGHVLHSPRIAALAHEAEVLAVLALLTARDYEDGMIGGGLLPPKSE